MKPHRQSDPRRQAIWRNIIKLRKLIPSKHLDAMPMLAKHEQLPMNHQLTAWKDEEEQARKMHERQVFKKTREGWIKRMSTLRGAAASAKAEDQPQALPHIRLPDQRITAEPQEIVDAVARAWRPFRYIEETAHHCGKLSAKLDGSPQLGREDPSITPQLQARYCRRVYMPLPNIQPRAWNAGEMGSSNSGHKQRWRR